MHRITRGPSGEISDASALSQPGLSLYPTRSTAESTGLGVITGAPPRLKGTARKVWRDFNWNYFALELDELLLWKYLQN